MVVNPRIGVLVAQLGTPDAPTPAAVRRYLKQFLSDTRVVDLNPLLWQIILRLFVLPFRSRRSAALYRRIWQAEGSPLLVHSQAVTQALQAELGAAYDVRLGMIYGSPAIAGAVHDFRQAGIDRILALPMYPQYSSSTTASVYDAVNRAAGGRRCPLFLERKRDYPTLRFVPPYYADPLYIAALKAVFEGTFSGGLRPAHVLMSFHGNPQRYIDEGDPYAKQCEVTADLLADALGLAESAWSMAYQSKFGPGDWLQPSTDAVLEALPGQGRRAVAVVCPGFTADCLETLDEMGREARETFEAAGGESFSLVPCLNSHPAWVEALAGIVRRESAGWA